MFAIVLAVMAIVAATMFFSSVSRAAAHTERMAAAAELAQARIESLLQLTYGRMSNGSDRVGDYRRVWQATPGASQAQIQVLVSWPELGGNSRTVTVRTIRTP